MDRPLRLEYETRYDGVRGAIEITDAWLGEGANRRNVGRS
jgi:hypothetical protein